MFCSPVFLSILFISRTCSSSITCDSVRAACQADNASSIDEAVRDSDRKWLTDECCDELLQYPYVLKHSSIVKEIVQVRNGVETMAQSTGKRTTPLIVALQKRYLDTAHLLMD